VYGLIHSRFITSPKGLALMREKYLLGRFGVCPRVLCERQNVLPVGMSEELRTSRVKVQKKIFSRHKKDRILIIILNEKGILP